MRRPVYVRGRRHIRIGAGFTSGVGLRLDAFPPDDAGVCLTIGSNVEVNDYVHIAAISSIAIGDDVLIASKVLITDHNHGRYVGADSSVPEVRPAGRRLDGAAVTIEDRVWLGESVCVMPGVTIGHGSVIGALSVVSKSVPADSVAVGAPARVIKTFNRRTHLWEKT